MPRLITLIPNSGVQFLDLELSLESKTRLSRSFWEERISNTPLPNGTFPVLLRSLVPDADGVPSLPDTGVQPPDEEIYAIGRNGAIEMHMNHWVPLPFFLALPRGQMTRPDYDRGPTNWARARLATVTGADDAIVHRLTLAFDTALLPRPPDGPYTGLSPDNSVRQQEFAFVPQAELNGWFLDEAWLGDWLREMLVELRSQQRRGRPLRPEDMPHACEHYARYLVFLALLDEAQIIPNIRLLDTVSADLGYKPVAVDLVLDIGNARTCGILIEEHPDEGQRFADSYKLELRDLSRPELVYADPFESRVEFSRASFGREAIARRAGRASAFSWPSPLRVGPEAVRLAGSRIGNEGATGLSSPKRYLWDERPFTQGWKFNGKAMDGVTVDPPVSGAFMALVSEDGKLLRRGGGTPATRARFSRSAIFTFMLAEILLQALNQMNAAGTRERRRDTDKPRRLRSVQMTMPPGMPVVEQAIMRSRVDAAVQLTWAMLGWGGRPAPVVKAALDEATATQLVWLHNEVTERLQGDAGTLFRMVGQVRPEIAPAPSLRLASIDIGGGTTDLMVTTYTLQGETIVPRQEFRESFKIAGDDLLERVITQVVLPPVEAALAAAGVADPKALLARTLKQDGGGQAEQERHLRRLFVSSVLEPAAIAMLGQYEAGAEALAAPMTISSVLGANAAGAARALAYIDDAAAAAGARGFSVASAELVVEPRRLGVLIASILGPVLADLCEVVWSYGCDVLLLSGRPSRLPAVMETVLAKLPVPPHRIIGMHRYRVGGNYPFKDSSNRIEDPKTTAVVGAAICVQAEGRLQNFTLRTRGLVMRSTARILGKMANDGQIRRDSELLTNLDLDGPLREDVSFEVMFSTATHIGFRQLPVERWTATPLYMMEFANPDNAQAFDLPLIVKVQRKEADEDDPTAHERLEVAGVMDANRINQSDNAVRLRLQTMEDGDGYWRDTGRLSLT